MRLALTALGALAFLSAQAMAQGPEGQRIGAHGLALPASFTGILPCADCPGIAHHLDLWPGGGYALRVAYIDRDDVEQTVGRWHVDPARRALVLDGREPLEWQITGQDALRLLDREGNPIVSDLPYDLAGGPLAPFDLSLPATGEFTYFADAALFTVCATGERMPVVMEGDYLALERAYLAAGVPPMAPLLARIDARIALAEAMEGPPRRSVHVDRLHHVTPDGACRIARAPAEPVNSFWRIDLVDGVPLPADTGREPYLLLLPDDDGATRFSATLGCNMMMGSYALADGGLSFGPVASTMMACPSPLDTLEQTFAALLEGTAGFDGDGHSLTLTDGDGRVRIQLTAVHTPW